eukprot:scaffold14274_cov65-Phaeocystis_antarctica.AAC.6
MKASSASSAAGRMPSSACVASAASRMPDSKRFRKYSELEASATRCALNSTPSAQRAKSVSRSSRQRPASEGWCGTPPPSVSLGAAVAGFEENEALAVAAMRARFLGAMVAKFGGDNRGTQKNPPGLTPHVSSPPTSRPSTACDTPQLLCLRGGLTSPPV